MSRVGKVSDHEQILESDLSFVVAPKVSSKLQFRKTTARGVARYLTDVKVKSPQRKKEILSLLEGSFRAAISKKNIDDCAEIAASLGIVDEEEEEELIIKLEEEFTRAKESDAFDYDGLEKRLGYEGIAKWLEEKNTYLTQKDEGTLLEMINYLVKVDDDSFSQELERVRTLYEIYGDDAFPWRLPTMKEYSERYLLRSQIEEEDGENYYEEDVPCRNNNCGSKRSRIQIFEHVRTDNGKMIIKNCIKCGVIRH